VEYSAGLGGETTAGNLAGATAGSLIQYLWSFWAHPANDGDLSLYRCCRSLQIQGEQSAGRAHPVPVVFVRGTAAQTDLVVAAIVVEPWPGKTVRATSSEDPLQESHLRAPLLGNAPQPFGADGDSSFGQTRCSEAYFRPW